MIYDATVEAECDHCKDTVSVEPDLEYTDYSGTTSHYDCSDSAIEKKLVDDHEWVIGDDGQYCSEACKKDAEA